MWFKDGNGMVQMRERHDKRAEVIDIYRPDVMALVETWLRRRLLWTATGGLAEIERACIGRQ